MVEAWQNEWNSTILWFLFVHFVGYPIRFSCNYVIIEYWSTVLMRNILARYRKIEIITLLELDICGKY
jgi:hypothetical protein